MKKKFRDLFSTCVAKYHGHPADNIDTNSTIDDATNEIVLPPVRDHLRTNSA